MPTVLVKIPLMDVVPIAQPPKKINSVQIVHVMIVIVTSIVAQIKLNVNNLKQILVSLIVTLLNTDVVLMILPLN